MTLRPQNGLEMKHDKTFTWHHRPKPQIVPSLQTKRLSMFNTRQCICKSLCYTLSLLHTWRHKLRPEKGPRSISWATGKGHSTDGLTSCRAPRKSRKWIMIEECVIICQSSNSFWGSSSILGSQNVKLDICSTWGLQGGSMTKHTSWLSALQNSA